MDQAATRLDGTRGPHQLPDAHRAEAEAALEVLLDSALDPIVDMVCTSRDGAYEALAHDGRVSFRRTAGGYERIEVSGRDPLADQSIDRFTPLSEERANPFPNRTQNAYPHAFDQIAQLFDSPAAPDLCVLHSASHNWEDQGGHLGEHGSLGLVQARAPFVLAGKGVRNLGLIPESARLVDVAPTLCALLGCAPLGGADGGHFLAVQDGRALTDLLDPADRPRYVFGFLFDGTNANVLYDMAARGEAPNVARLIEMGTALGHGAFASLPTVTLANHTSIITGAHPGHHGILHNAWFDRAAGRQVITNSSATWPWSMQHLLPGVETIHHAVHRTWPDAFTASVNEPCDTGADYSTFDFFRRGEVPPIPKDPFGLPHTTERFVRPSKDYSWSSIVDHMGVDQAVGIIGGSYRDQTYPTPRFCWCNFTLTDAAMHEGGPYSEIAAASVRDSDGRIGEILGALEHAGVFDECAFALVADHGMEQNDPGCRGDWDVALREAGIDARDEAYGFLYFGVPRA
ncbi:MAG TPA: alkaline phosphatase family protein [Acidimicrobiia bacterium]|nr:alkaline phosphatase family protein [Acidimicrobiia bacterium]